MDTDKNVYYRLVDVCSFFTAPAHFWTYLRVSTSILGISEKMEICSEEMTPLNWVSQHEINEYVFHDLIQIMIINKQLQNMIKNALTSVRLHPLVKQKNDK